MPQFRYTARSTDGKLVDGVVECHDRAAAIRQVETRRFVPIKIEALAAAAAASATSTAENPAPAARKLVKPAAAKSKRDEPEIAPPPSAKESISYGQQHLFTEQLANLLGAGMTLDEALAILTRRMKHPRLQGLAGGLHQALVDGRALSQALRDYPRIFTPLYINLVAAGEASGALAEILRRLVAHLADVKGLRDRVTQALIYPAMLVLAAIGLIFIFITVMVPQLIGVFKDSGMPLPGPTKLLLDLNYLFSHYWWAGAIAVVSGYTLFKAFTRTPSGRKTWDALVWRMPLISTVLRARFYAQFARTLGTLMENGVTLLRALSLLEEISGNEFVRAKMEQVRRAVVDGATLSTAVAEQELFPEMFVDMMSVGEQAGKFGTTMHNIADVYERELGKQVQIISSIIPPIVVVGIGLLVGFVVYSILTAVFGMTQSMRTGR